MTLFSFGCDYYVDKFSRPIVSSWFLFKTIDISNIEYFVWFKQITVFWNDKTYGWWFLMRDKNIINIIRSKMIMFQRSFVPIIISEPFERSQYDFYYWVKKFEWNENGSKRESIDSLRYVATRRSQQVKCCCFNTYY